MASTVLSISKRDGRWFVAADGKPMATAESAERALATAIDAVGILRKSGIAAELAGSAALEEPKSFEPKD